MSALKTRIANAVRAEMIGSLVTQAREAGIKDMIAFFVGVHLVHYDRRDIIMHPKVIALGRELLECLTRGEDIHPVVVLTAMNRHSQLHQDVLAVPFERYRNHVPTLVRLVDSNNVAMRSEDSYKPCRLLAIKRLEELHRNGTRLSYENVSRIVMAVEIAKVDEDDYLSDIVFQKSASADYFRRLKERVGRRRARRRLKYTWTHYRLIVTPIHNHPPTFKEIETWVMRTWDEWAEQRFNEACNRLYDRLVQEQRPFPNTYISPYWPPPPSR